MAQPVKKKNKTKKETVRKNNSVRDNRLPSNKNIKVKKRGGFYHNNKKHPEYGTSKLEERFAKEFLDKIGFKYIYQFKMKSIRRYIDFLIVDNLEHPSIMIAIEIDGTYYHSYGLTYEQMNPMQKRNKRVDEIKNEWCARNGVPLIRIWENEINDRPNEVLKMLKDKLGGLITHEDKRMKPKIKIKD